MSTDKKQRTSIKWQKLGGAKDPEFKKPYFLFAKTGEKDKPAYDYSMGYLEAIKSAENGKEYAWNVRGGESETETHYTHFCECKPAE